MSFQQFWQIYPRKTAKRVAEKAWEKLKQEEQIDCLDALPNHIAYWKLKQIENEFIPYPATFLNQGRWEDELDMTVKEIKKPGLPWYASEELTLAKARELGINPYAGENYAQLRQRIQAQMQRAATM